MARQVVETARNGVFRLDVVADGDGLHREVYVRGQLLASSAHAVSSALLADRALAGIGAQKHAEVLIGGLGVGLVLRRVLQHPAVHLVWAVEPRAQVVAWNRDRLGNADVLDDPRVELIVGDFCDYVQGMPRNYNGIALQFEATRPEHRRIYSLSMLNLFQMRLRSGGALAFVAQEANAACERALKEVFDRVTVESVVDREADGSTRTCVIYQAYT